MKFDSDKITHIYSITMSCCLIFMIGFQLYICFERGDITWDGWMTLVFIFSVNLMYINYWKEYLSKD